MDTIPTQTNIDPKHKKSKISFDMLVHAVRDAWHRFPVTVVYIAYLALWSVIQIIGDFFGDDNLVASLWYLGSMGVPLSLAVYLWCEYLRRPSRLPMMIANLLLVADCICIFCFESSLGMAWNVGRGAMFAALAVAIIFIPSRSPMAWNFSNSQVTGLIIAAAFGWAFMLALGAIFMTINGLFGLDIWKPMACAQAVCAGSVPAVIFLHLIPRRDESERDEKVFFATKFQCGTAKYFFLMVTVIYMAILYVYGFKILFTWELPRGIVSLSVTGLTAAVFVTLFFLEGVRRTHPTDSLTLKAIRVLPVAMIPLLVLMSVAVLYRIGEYGLTVSRLYVLTFNLWCYGVFIYLMVSRLRIYNAVAISFAVVFLATSIVPYFNFTTLSDVMMQRKLRERLVELGFTEFPVSEEAFIPVFERLDSRDRMDLRSIIKELDRHGNQSGLDGIIEPSLYTGYNSAIYSYRNDNEGSAQKSVDLNYRKSDVSIPDGFRKVDQLNEHMSKLDVDNGNGAISLGGTDFLLPADSLIHLSDSVYEPVILHAASGTPDTVFVAERISFYYVPATWSGKREVTSLNIYGYKFTR